MTGTLSQFVTAERVDQRRTVTVFAVAEEP